MQSYVQISSTRAKIYANIIAVEDVVVVVANPTCGIECVDVIVIEDIAYNSDIRCCCCKCYCISFCYKMLLL